MDKFVKQVNEWKPFNEPSIKENVEIIKKPIFSIKCDLFGKKFIKEDIDKIKKKNFYKNDESHIHEWKLIEPDIYYYETIDNKRIKKITKKGVPGKYYCVKCNKKHIVMHMCEYNGYIEMFEYFKSIATYADQNSLTPLKLPYEFLFCSCVKNSPYVCGYCLGRSLKPSYSSTLNIISKNEITNENEIKNLSEKTTIIYNNPKYVPFNLRPTRTQLYRKHLGLNDEDKLPIIYSSVKYDYNNNIRVLPNRLFISHNDINNNIKNPSLCLKTIQFKG
jgi:hypothetical protein